MIVIATNNGNEYLPNLLASIDTYGCDNHKICIVDTGSTDNTFIEYLANLDKNKYIITHTPYKGYDTGAYIHAYRNFASSEYIFMQDSIEVISSDWVSEFKKNNSDACYYTAFGTFFDTESERQHIIDIGIYNPNTVKCVFGPIFYIKKPILDSISQRFNLDKVIPTNKQEQMGMERGWAMMIDTVTRNRSWLGVFEEWAVGRPWDENPTVMYKTLRKYRPVRK